MKSKFLKTILVTVIILACSMIPTLKPKPTPLPGWGSPVSTLLVDDSAFPEGWVREREFPDTPDPTINHVYRQWWWKARGDGAADQAIWRAYTIEDAKEQYTKLRQQSMFRPDFTPSPGDLYIAFKSPPEIDFHSENPDDFFMACGWLYEAQCHVISRYRNYFTFISLDLESESQGYTTVGMTYSEIESVVRAMDAKFAEFLRAFPQATAVP
jgi:hypothetical protein